MIIAQILFVYILFQIFDKSFSLRPILNAILRVLASLGIIAIFGSAIYWFDYYNWPNSVKKEIGGSEITYVATDTEWDITRPYSWIWGIPKEILLVKNKSCGRLDSQYYFTQYVNISREFEVPTTNLIIYDILNGKHTIVNEKFMKEASFADLKKLDFVQNKNWIDITLDTFIVNFVKPYNMIGMLGENLDITSFISMGFYSIKDAYKSTAYSLLNNAPYCLTKNDYQLLNVEIHKFFDPNLFILPANFNKSNTKYKESRIGYKITDFFETSIKTNTGKDTTIEFTFSQLTFPKSDEPNSVIISN